jgi:hypothetical protein
LADELRTLGFGEIEHSRGHDRFGGDETGVE